MKTKPKSQAIIKSKSASLRLRSPLLGEVREMILQARQQVATTVNAGLTLLYWQVGDRIRREVLQEKRAEYGAEILPTLSAKLVEEFGKGWGTRNPARMVKFAEAFPDGEIVASLLRQLGWSHFTELISLKDPLQRDFYAEMCRIDRWSVRTLRERIDSMFYERTAISKKPEKLIEQELKQLRLADKLTPDLIFRDPYVLDFLGLKDTYSEKDLEEALLREIERTLLEMGRGFAFVERQKRLIVDGEDFYIDLLFYHRDLRRLVVIELKLGDFKPADMGQMMLYLSWLDQNERREGEESPVGIILCAGKKGERVEYLGIGRNGIHVAEYLTALPSKAELKAKFHAAILRAREVAGRAKAGE